MELYEKYKSLFEAHDVNTHLRKAHFMAQIEHESGLKPISENLNYSAKRLKEVFPKYFATVEKANLYANKPEKIGNRIYANRMGNGDEASGEGYKYRGRGYIQLTGKDNYSWLSKSTMIDFVGKPDSLLEEPNAMIAALSYWSRNRLNSFADKDDCKSITKAINGGYIGLESRQELVKKWKNKL